MRAHAQAACGRRQLAERISQMFKSSRLSARSRPPHVCTEDGEKAGKEREWSSLLLNPWQGSRAPSMTDRQTDRHARTHACVHAGLDQFPDFANMPAVMQVCREDASSVCYLH